MDPAAFRTVGGPGFAHSGRSDRPHDFDEFLCPRLPWPASLPAPGDGVGDRQQWFLVGAKMAVLQDSLAAVLPSRPVESSSIELDYRFVRLEDDHPGARRGEVGDKAVKAGFALLPTMVRGTVVNRDSRPQLGDGVEDSFASPVAFVREVQTPLSWQHEAADELACPREISGKHGGSGDEVAAPLALVDEHVCGHRGSVPDRSSGE